MTVRTVAFLGPEGTFAAEAVERIAPEAERRPVPTIPGVVDAVRDGRVDLGVVPIESSTEGSVNLTLDELAFGAPGAHIRGEVNVPVSMALLAADGTAPGDVTEVRSHPHALSQCRAWLQRELPDARREAVSSTGEAARQVADGVEGLAAIGTRVAAERYGLKVLADGVQDREGNVTRFVALGRAMHPPTGTDRTSMVVFFGEDRPGLLLRVLQDFAMRGINLSKIESRPTKQQLGEYCIFIDCAGHVAEARVGEALRGVHRHVAEVRVLGSYPRADGVAEQPEPGDADADYEAAVRWYHELLDRVGEV